MPNSLNIMESIAIYPRKGTETRRPKCKSRRMPIAIYPREGTETPFPARRASWRYCNLSPQGDGHRKNSFQIFTIAIYPRKGTKKHLCHWRLPAAEVLCFFLYSILQVGNCACRNRLCDRQRLDALRDVPLQGADLMQVGGDLLQGLFNVLCIQRQNALAL